MSLASQVLVLDEATSSLDYDTESSVISSISKFAKDMTIIMITHRIPSLSNCNKIYKLDHGKIHEIKIQFLICLAHRLFTLPCIRDAKDEEKIIEVLT